MTDWEAVEEARKEFFKATDLLRDRLVAFSLARGLMTEAELRGLGISDLAKLTNTWRAIRVDAQDEPH